MEEKIIIKSESNEEQKKSFFFYTKTSLILSVIFFVLSIFLLNVNMPGILISLGASLSYVFLFLFLYGVISGIWFLKAKSLSITVSNTKVQLIKSSNIYDLPFNFILAATASSRFSKISIVTRNGTYNAYFVKNYKEITEAINSVITQGDFNACASSAEMPRMYNQPLKTTTNNKKKIILIVGAIILSLVAVLAVISFVSSDGYSDDYSTQSSAEKEAEDAAKRQIGQLYRLKYKFASIEVKVTNVSKSGNEWQIYGKVYITDDYGYHYTANWDLILDESLEEVERYLGEPLIN